jgi:hypothetical protein
MPQMSSDEMPPANIITDDSHTRIHVRGVNVHGHHKPILHKPARNRLEESPGYITEIDMRGQISDMSKAFYISRL